MLKKLNIYKYKAKNRIQIKFVYFYQNFMKNLFIHEDSKKYFLHLENIYIINPQLTHIKIL
jgi:hypothetical protein